MTHPFGFITWDGNQLTDPEDHECIQLSAEFLIEVGAEDDKDRIRELLENQPGDDLDVAVNLIRAWIREATDLRRALHKREQAGYI